jgi:8-oxo-dGTP pyrophosphatase MutT (NUDIX family)
MTGRLSDHRRIAMGHKTLYADKWLELRQTEDGYTYSHDGAGAGDGQKVAVLVLHPENGMVLGRYEYTPCHKPGIKLCSITGGVQNNDPLTTAIHELDEEAGIKTTPDLLVSLGTVWPSKSSDTVCHLFALMWNGEINENPAGDGSEGEKGAQVKWVHPLDAMACDDPLMPTLMSRVHVLRLSQLQEATK